MEKGIIYILTNEISGKSYIGQTIGTMNERWAQHKCDSKRRNTAIAAAIRKYGSETFKIAILEEDIPYSELDEKEISYIEQYKTVTPNGYNISLGGNTYRNEEERERMRQRVLGEKNPMYGMSGELNAFYGKVHSEETKRMIGSKAKLRWQNLSEEERNRRIAHLDKLREKIIDERGGGFAGKHHSQESIDKIKASLKGIKRSETTRRLISENNARKAAVYMLDKTTGDKLQRFESMTLACEWLKANTTYYKAKSSEISMACSGKKKSAYGFKWERI